MKHILTITKAALMLLLISIPQSFKLCLQCLKLLTIQLTSVNFQPSFGFDEALADAVPDLGGDCEIVLGIGDPANALYLKREDLRSLFAHRPSKNLVEFYLRLMREYYGDEGARFEFSDDGSLNQVSVLSVRGRRRVRLAF